MSREPKKRKGEILESKRANLERQKVFDALKKMREEGSAWLNIDGHRVKISSFDDHDNPSHRHVLAQHDGRIRLCFIVNKDGWIISSPDNGKFYRRVQPGAPDVLALVSEIHERKS